jgi:hypothetical protein
MTNDHNNLIEHLRVMDKRWRSVLLMTGCARTLLLFLLVLVGFCLFDWFMAFSFSARIVIALLLYAVVVAYAWQTCLREWLRPFDPVRTAWRIEDRCSFDEKLVSAVDFQNRDAPKLSRLLMERVLNELEHDLGYQTGDDAFPIPWKLLRLPTAATAAILLMCAVPHTHIADSVGRILVPRSTDGTVGFTMLEVVAPGTTAAIEGQPLAFRVRSTGSELEQIELVVESHAKRAIPMSYDFAASEYRVVLDDVHESFRYWARSDAVRSPSFIVTTTRRPRVDAFVVAYEYPEYTRRGYKSLESTTGDITALQGTMVSVVVHSSKPLTAARMIVTSATNSDDKRVITGELAGDQQVVFSFVLEENGSYVLNLTDADGLAPMLSPAHRITMLADQPPDVRLTAPETDLALDAGENVEMKWAAQDDFGVKRQSLVVAVNSQLHASKPLAAGTSSFVIPLRELPLLPGDDVSLWIEAHDGADNIARSEVRHITVGADRTLAEAAAFFAAAEPLLKTLAEAQVAGERVVQLSERLGSITNEQALDRDHFETQFNEHVRHFDGLLQRASEQSADLRRLAFFPRGATYIQLVERYIEQERLGSLNAIAVHKRSDNAAPLADLVRLSAVMIDLTVSKGRHWATHQVLPVHYTGAERGVAKLPATMPLVNEILRKLQAAAAGVDLPMAGELESVEPGPAVLDAARRLQTEVAALVRDHAPQEKAAEAIRKRLKQHAGVVAELAEELLIYRRDADWQVVEEIAADLARAASETDDADDRLEQSLQADILQRAAANRDASIVQRVAATMQAHGQASALHDRFPDIVDQYLAAALAAESAREALDNNQPNDRVRAMTRAAIDAAQHVEAAARIRSGRHRLNELEARAREAARLGSQAAEALVADNRQEAAESLRQMERQLDHAAGVVKRTQEAAEDASRLARQQLADLAPRKSQAAKAIADAVEAQSSPTRIDANLAALIRRLQDEAAVSRLPPAAPGGTNEKAAIIARLQSLEETLASKPEDAEARHSAATELADSVDLIAAHERLEERHDGSDAARSAHDRIMQAAAVMHGEHNHERYQRAVLEQALLNVDTLARQAVLPEAMRDARQLISRTTAISENLMQMDAAGHAPETNSRPSERHTGRIIDSLDSLDRLDQTLREASARQQRRDRLRGMVEDTRNAAQRQIEAALQERLPARTREALEAAHNELLDNDGNIHDDGHRMHDAAARARSDGEKELAEALMSIAKALTEQQPNNGRLREDIARLKELRQRAESDANTAARPLIGSQPDTAAWGAELKSRLDDNLAAENFAKAARNARALRTTLFDAARLESPPPGSMDTDAAARAALEHALDHATSSQKSVVQKAVDAFNTGDLKMSRDLIEQVAQQLRAEALLAERINDASRRAEGTELLRTALEDARAMRLSHAALKTARARGGKTAAEQLAAAETAISDAVAQAFDHAATAEKRTIARKLEEAAAAGHSKRLEQAARLAAAAGVDGKDTQAAFERAERKTQSAILTLESAYETAKEQTPTVQARQAAESAAAELAAAAAAAEQRVEARRGRVTALEKASVAFKKGRIAEATGFLAGRADSPAAQEALASLQRELERVQQLARKVVAETETEELDARRAVAAVQEAAQAADSGDLEAALKHARNADAVGRPMVKALRQARAFADALGAIVPEDLAAARQAVSASQAHARRLEHRAQRINQLLSQLNTPQDLENAARRASAYAGASSAAKEAVTALGAAMAARAAERAAPARAPTATTVTAAAVAADLATAARALEDSGDATASYDAALRKLSQAVPTTGTSTAPENTQVHSPSIPPANGAGGSGGSGPGTGGSQPGSAAVTADIAEVPKTTWTDFWRGTGQQLTGSDQQGQVHQYGDFYRRANKRYLSRIVAESRKNSDTERKQ